MTEAQKQIIKNYAHDFRDNAMSEEQLEKMLTDFYLIFIKVIHPEPVPAELSKDADFMDLLEKLTTNAPLDFMLKKDMASIKVFVLSNPDCFIELFKSGGWKFGKTIYGNRN